MKIKLERKWGAWGFGVLCEKYGPESVLQVIVWRRALVFIWGPR